MPAIECCFGMFVLDKSYKMSGYFFLFMVAGVPWSMCIVGISLKRKGWLYSVVACLASFCVIFAEILGLATMAFLSSGFEGVM